MTHPHAFLLLMALVAGFIWITRWSLRCAEQVNDALLRRDGLLS